MTVHRGSYWVCRWCCNWKLHLSQCLCKRSDHTLRPYLFWCRSRFIPYWKPTAMHTYSHVHVFLFIYWRLGVATEWVFGCPLGIELFPFRYRLCLVVHSRAQWPSHSTFRGNRRFLIPFAYRARHLVQHRKTAKYVVGNSWPRAAKNISSRRLCENVMWSHSHSRHVA